MVKIFYLDINDIDNESLSNKDYCYIANELIKKQKIGKDIILNYIKEKYNVKSEFDVNQFGKPYFKDACIKFNVSHSKDIVIVSVCDDEIGIDVLEYERNIKTNLCKLICNSNDENKELIDVWTIKEAYLKYIGIGLVKDINNIIVDYDKKLISYKDYNKGYYNSFDLLGYRVCYITNDRTDYEIEKIKKAF